MRKKALSQNRTKKSTTKSAGKDTKESAPISEYSRKEGLSPKSVSQISKKHLLQIKHLNKSNVCRQLLHSEFFVFW